MTNMGKYKIFEIVKNKVGISFGFISTPTDEVETEYLTPFILWVRDNDVEEKLWLRMLYLGIGRWCIMISLGYKPKKLTKTHTDGLYLIPTLVYEYNRNGMFFNNNKTEGYGLVLGRGVIEITDKPIT